MSPIVRFNLDALLRFPRVSGDEPHAPGQGGDAQQFSPRERG